MRALFSPVFIFSILLSSVAYGSSLQPGPYGSAPTGKSFIVTFDASADTRSAYVVDSKGFFWPSSNSAQSATQIGGFAASADTSNKGFSPTGALADVSNSRSISDGTGGGFSGVAGFFSSSGGGSTSLWASKALHDGSDFGAVNNNFSDPGSTELALEGIRGSGPSVSTTPLPASWTMMLIGLLSFGLLARFRRPKMSENRPREASIAAG